MRALIYTRVSEDRAGGRSPEEQEAEARQVCAREGWEIVDVVTDTAGASRHSNGRRRGWDNVQKLLGARSVDVLVTWEASRAQRDLAAYVELREICSSAGVLWSYSGRTFDLSDSGDRFTTGLDALLAEREAGEIAHWVQRAVRANAVKGRPHGRRLFGYRRVYDEATGLLIGQEPHPQEADVVRRIFRDFVGGAGARNIARDLRAEGVKTGTGAEWNEAQVRRAVMNPAYAARRVHQGEVIGPADWPALVDEDTFDRAQAIRVDRRTRNHRVTYNARLLTGVGRCGKCGGKVHCLHDRGGRKVYTCKDRFEVSRDMLKLDEFVSAIVVERLSRPEATEALQGGDDHDRPDPTEQRIAELRARLADATEQFVAGNLTGPTLATIEQAIQPEIDELQCSARRERVGLAIDLPEPADMQDWWDQLELAQRREIVGALISTVTINPTVRGQRTFDPNDVVVEFR